MWKCQYCGNDNEGEYCVRCRNKKPEEITQKPEKEKNNSPALVIAVAIIVAAAMFIAFLGAYLIVVRPFSDDNEIEISTDYESAAEINPDTLKEEIAEKPENKYEDKENNKRPAEMLEPEMELEPAPDLEPEPWLEPAEELEPVEVPEQVQVEAEPMYRVRKSAKDAQSQLGAFADFKRAKICAIGNASDGYEVYDMNGNLVFDP